MSSVAKICISRIFEIWPQRSDQVSSFYHYSQWGKWWKARFSVNKCPTLLISVSKLFGPSSHSEVELKLWPGGAKQVTRGHARSNHVFTNISPHSGARVSIMVPIFSSHRDKSIDIQHDLVTWPLTLTWGQNLTLTFRGQKGHDSICLDERTTMVPSLFLYLS